jgi:hypothetical protein
MAGHEEEQNLRDLLGRAVEMVSTIPEQLRPVAYTWVLERIGSASARKVTAASARGRASDRAARNSPSDEESNQLGRLMETLVRTDHPEISLGKKALDLALGVLRASKLQGVEWLTPQEISGILKDKFGIKTEAPAIRMALKSSDYVDRRALPKGGYTYRIMAAGEQYLNLQVSEAV